MLSKLIPKLHAPLRSSRSLASVSTTCLGRTGRALAYQSFSSSVPIKRPTTPLSLPLDVPIEEELIPRYNPKDFYHPHPGDILDGRYELNAKLGFGTSSTVWLARDQKVEDKSWVAIKICTSDWDAAEHELGISRHIVECAGGDESKYENLRIIKDTFSIRGTHGIHLCLVMEPMREPIWLTRKRITATNRASSATIVLFKYFVGSILFGLEQLHASNMIHTDLKLDNLMMSFEHQSILARFVDAQVDNPMPRKVYPTHTVYLSHNDFGNYRRTPEENPFLLMETKIVDFGLAQRGVKADGSPLIHPIQVDQFHAPEVLLGAGWSYSADIWNLGIMIWYFLSGKDLFQSIYDENGIYSAKHHLADMCSILGPIPEALIQREKEMRHWRWHPEALNVKGKLCNNAAEFYGGPFINDGVFIGLDLVKPGPTLEQMLPDCITEGDKADFLDFMNAMLCWAPEQRKSASELLEHPWLTRWMFPPGEWKPPNFT